jgi:predicted permease
VISHAFWIRRFAAAADAVGSSLRINGRPYTIVGVTEEGFQGNTFIGTDLWVPFAMAPHLTGRASMELLTAHGPVWHLAIARLKDGVTAAQVRDELNGLLAPLKEAHPEAYSRWSIEVLPSARVPGDLHRPATTFVGVLFALTFMVLAIACSNVAGMLLARAMARGREMATRLAVGAGRAQIVLQLMSETLLLFTIAAVAGTALAWWMTSFLHSFMPAMPIPVVVDLHVDARVLTFALGLALLTAITFGLTPAFRATRVDIVTMLHGQHVTPDRKRMRLRHVLVAAQVALSLVLLVTTGVFLKSLRSAASADTGYDGTSVRVFTVDTSLAGRVGLQSAALAERLLDRIGRIGGVEAVATSRMIPLQGGRLGMGALRVPGYASPRWDVVSPAYFATLGVPIVAGRAFAGDDREGRPYVAIVNEAFAAAAWPGREAVGRVIDQATARNRFDRPLTIVGVARNANYRRAGESPVPFIYVPHAQQPQTEMNLYVREAPRRQVSVDVSRTIAEVEPNLPVITSQSFEEAAGIGLLPQRIAASIAGGVGVTGLLLAGLGLYGLMAFHSGQRTREVAVRTALGATSAQVKRLLLGQAASIVLGGAALGGVLSAGAAMSVRGLVPGVQPLDSLTFAMAAAVLAAVLLTAAWLPVRRAADADPAAALRAE